MQKLFLEFDRMTQKNEKRMHSYFFELLQALVFFLAWRFDNGTIAMVGVVVFCLMILLFSSDGGLFGGVLMLGLLSIPKLPYFDFIPVSVYVMAAALVVGLLLMTLKKIFVTKDLNLSFGSMGISLSLMVLLLLASSVVNQIVRTSEFAGYGWLAVGVAFIIVLFYFLFVFTSKEGYLYYLVKIFYALNILMFVELFSGMINSNPHIYNTGLGGKNVVSIVLEICIPFVAIAFARNKWRIDSIIIILIDYFFIIDSKSRGGLVTVLVLTLLLAYILSFASDNKVKRNKYQYLRNYIIAFSGIVLAIVIGYFYFEPITQGIDYLLVRGDDLSGREGIWDTALSYTKDNWLFGGSLSALFEMFVKYDFMSPAGSVGIWLCHNTFITFLASGGILVLLAYLSNVFETVRTSIKINSVIKYAVIYFILIGLIHGMIDNTYFSIIYMIPMVLIFSKGELVNAYKI